MMCSSCTQKDGRCMSLTAYARQPPRPGQAVTQTGCNCWKLLLQTCTKCKVAAEYCSRQQNMLVAVAHAIRCGRQQKVAVWRCHTRLMASLALSGCQIQLASSAGWGSCCACHVGASPAGPRVGGKGAGGAAASSAGGGTARSSRGVISRQCTSCKPVQQG